MKTPGMKIDSKSKSLNNTAADMPDTRDEKMILGGDSAFSTTPTLDLNISVTLRRTLDTEKQKKRRRAFQTNRNKDGGGGKTVLERLADVQRPAGSFLLIKPF